MSLANVTVTVIDRACFHCLPYLFRSTLLREDISLLRTMTKQRAVVGFYYDKGKVKPITKSQAALNHQKIIQAALISEGSGQGA
jgi:hypothetical protein